MTTTYVSAQDWPYIDRDGQTIVVLDTAHTALIAAGWTPPPGEQDSRTNDDVGGPARKAASRSS